MTEINFYVSKEQGLEHRLSIVHRLVVIAFKKNLKIHIHTDSEATNIKIDDYLWTKDSTGFIPHGIITADNSDVLVSNNKTSVADDNNAKENIYQINISHETEPLLECDYLINISNQRPTFFSRFSKMAEILDNNEEIITAGRKRYSFYRDRGYTLGYYQL